ncbi:hypothetical protein VNI00_004998 [Paramarasmius palmivorus]|uniref:Uncharacterized protein n=1 Tax=Paramarasmius palmivorus TaxID=297713 RepID=A0AAW0DED7_9AGAR
MPSVEPTPSSEKSLYFDAPIANFTMQDQDQPIPKPDGSEPVADLTREPTVAGGATAPLVNGANGDKKASINGVNGVDDIADEAGSGGEEKYTAHPNGSEGWLPATDVPPDAETSRGDSKVPVNGSTFVNGAGTTGPGATAIPDESFQQRVTAADGALTAKQKSKISKQEVKEGKRLSKIIKQEGKVEKQALEVAINELAELQKIQNVKLNVILLIPKAVQAFQKAETAYLAARTKFETAQALMLAEQDTLDIARNAAVEATTKMQEKSQEVDSLRQTFGVDERERAVKISELTASKSKSRWR